MAARLTTLALLLSLGTTAIAQNSPGQPRPGDLRPAEYKAGQVWEIDLHSLATILKVETVPRIGTVIHIRVDRIPIQSCSKIQLTSAIEHIAITEKMMRNSATALAKEKVDVPDSYLEAYRTWENAKKHKVSKTPLSETIRLTSDQPCPIMYKTASLFRSTE